MTEREKRKRAEKIDKAGKAVKSGASVVKIIFSVIGLVLGALVIYGFVSAGMAVHNAFAGIFGG